MLTSIEINGFRGFERLQIPNLAPVTVFTGMNGAGKTTVLEAILALHGRFSPTWVLNLQAHHGFSKLSSSSGPNYLGLFYGFRDAGSATIKGVFGAGAQCELVLERSTSGQQGQIPPTGPSSTGVGAPVTDLICKAYRGSKLVNETALVWTHNPPQPPQLTVRGGRDPERRAVLVHPSGQAAGEEEIARFGDAMAAGRTGRIVDAMRLLNESIEGIEYIPKTTGEYFAAKINGIPRPLGLLGAGINHIFRFLVGLDHVRGGCLAIDEVENGIHHSALEKVFKAIIHCALEDETQLVISTHSAEALAAIGRAAGDHGKNVLGVVHMARGKKDVIEAHVFRGADAVSSIQLGYEMR
ncbi:MAG: AAA family ATPase [Phycisphaerales bacterium]|nr:AAA family ATPase [Phycisphaerales bacterium]